MTLQQIPVDDLTWADLMAQIRAAIPAESGGTWTLHAPVDPGITLLELFAAQLEQRLYWLEHVPDSLVRGILGLLGVPSPAPAALATTVLAFEPGTHRVPAATAVSSPGDPDAVVLTTDDDLDVLPVEALRLVAGGRDRTAELRRGVGPGPGSDPFGTSRRSRGAGVDLLPADGGVGEAEIVLQVPAVSAPPPGGDLTLALLVEPDGDLPPAWAPGAVPDVPPPADVTWSYAADGRVAPFPDGVVDGTGGLRRSGVVRLPWPDPWRTPAAFGIAERRIVIRTAAATFAAPPRLVGVWPNAVTARHRLELDSVTDAGLADALLTQAAAWLPLPNRVLQVPFAAGRLRDDPGSVVLDLVERDGRDHRWRATSDLSFHGPGDRVFTVDRPLGLLRFGDGLAGRIPVPERRSNGAPTGLRLQFEVGAGAAGNRGSHLTWETVDGPIRTAVNVAPLAGGADPETTAAARARAGDELNRRYRAVTAPDHATIATDRDRLGVTVARVHVGVGRHPGFPCDVVPGSTTVVVVPDVRREPGTGMPVVAAPQPDPGMVAAVRRRLDDARLAASEIHVERPRYREVAVSVTLAGGVADPPASHATLRNAFARHLDPLIGGGGSGWPFGDPLRPSDLFGVAQRAVGSSATVAAVAIGLDGGPVEESCADVALRPHELPVLVGLDLRVSAAPATEGGLA